MSKPAVPSIPKSLLLRLSVIVRSSSFDAAALLSLANCFGMWVAMEGNWRRVWQSV